MFRQRIVALSVVLAVTLGAAWQRARAVERLPADFDELVYLPVAYRYAEMLQEGRWREVVAFRENFEHPPMVKLLYASELRVSGAVEPDWTTMKARAPLPDAAVPAFRVTRWLSAVAGIQQVALTATVSPLGALLLAFDPYHAAYTSLAYLEAVPGLFAMLGVWAFERARRTASTRGGALHPGWLFASGALIGLAAAGKYPYGLVAGLTLLPFLVIQARTQARAWACVVAPALVLFFAANPALWPAPLSALGESLTFHWNYSRGGEDVRRIVLPWFQPIMYLIHPGPAKWHAGVFATGVNAWILLPLALLGVRTTARERPVWAVWAGVGLAFLLLWPTKWPQYQLLLLPAACVFAGNGLRMILRHVGAVASRRIRPPPSRV